MSDSTLRVATRGRSESARGVYIDGGQVARAFLREGLVDEITLSRVPVLIGEDKPLFGVLPHDVELQLVENRTLGGGMIQTRDHIDHSAQRTP